MDNRDKQPPVRRGGRPDRAERLAEALRANLKRRKAQARGRAGQGEDAGGGENQANHAGGKE